jgi:hypothetical protein
MRWLDIREEVGSVPWEECIEPLEKSDDSRGDKSEVGSIRLERRFEWQVVSRHALCFKCFHEASNNIKVNCLVHFPQSMEGEHIQMRIENTHPREGTESGDQVDEPSKH